ncbi:MAG: mannonate dehydratase [Bacillota bacterium]
MKYGWRWFGPNDPVKIEDVMQVGATDVVSALHYIPNGEVWPIVAIEKRQREVECSAVLERSTGLIWSVVESVPVHEDIKKRTGDYAQYIENYKATLRNLAICGIKTVIYNFMPVLDWTRTDLAYELPCGRLALRYDAVEVAAFDLFVLQRKSAKNDYTPERQTAAKKYYDNATNEQIEKLTCNIIAGLPGAEESFSVEEFRAALGQYAAITAEELRSNLVQFLQAVIPTAEDCGMKLAIHPDDPPWPLFGVPRIMSNVNDAEYILKAVDSTANGINLCAGSLGASAENDLPKIFRRLRGRVPFVHLRSVQREADGSFYEDEHLAGSTSLCDLIREILQYERELPLASFAVNEVTIRSDHGHQMLDDLQKKTNPGYSCIGRMKGLAEIKGMAQALRRRHNV